MLKLSIIGSGVVGEATGKGFQNTGHEVYFYDISQQRLDTLAHEGYRTAHQIEEALSKTEISFICVNTPPRGRTGTPIQDLSQLTTVLHDVVIAINQLHNKEPNYNVVKGARHTRHTTFSNQADLNDVRTGKTRFPLLVFRSTILPGTMRNIIVEYLDTHCSLRRGIDYEVLYNPEFLRETYAVYDFLNPDRVVIGADHISSSGGEIGSNLLKQLYEPLSKNIIVTNFETAELIKYAANCFLSMKISYFNEIGIICRKLGLDTKIVNHAVSLDKRIGSYGTHAGMPYSGGCLPKDVEAFAAFVHEVLSLDTRSDLLHSTISINNIIANEVESAH